MVALIGEMLLIEGHISTIENLFSLQAEKLVSFLGKRIAKKDIGYDSWFKFLSIVARSAHIAKTSKFFEVVVFWLGFIEEFKRGLIVNTSQG